MIASADERPSKVPLRVWIASDVSDVSLVKRQWLADSEQPAEFTILDEQELLAQTECNCDVVVYPARLLGDVIARNWIVGLSRLNPEQNDESSNPRSDAALAQATFDGQPMAVSLGCSIPVIAASDAMSVELESDAVSWPKLIANLEVEKESQRSIEKLDFQLDPSALVDRYLAIVATLSERNAMYGLLFEMQTMQPRLTEDEFLEAAGILMDLSRQPDGLKSVLGSHDDTWSWLGENQQAVVAIVPPAVLSQAALADVQGTTIEIERPSSDSSLSGWNTGGGLLASLPTNCRQTDRATAMIRWFGTDKTRSTIAPMLRGAESPAVQTGAETLAWQARQHLVDALADAAIPKEPSLPHSLSYRRVLGEQLIEFLVGDKSATQALQDAAAAWSDITNEAGVEGQRTQYEKSLGLIL